MRGKFSKKQIGVLGVAVLITAQTPAMAAEESQVQQEETAVVQEVETELSDLVESIPEAESESAETLSEIELQAEELEPEISEAEEEIVKHYVLCALEISLGRDDNFYSTSKKILGVSDNNKEVIQSNEMYLSNTEHTVEFSEEEYNKVAEFTKDCSLAILFTIIENNGVNRELIIDLYLAILNDPELKIKEAPHSVKFRLVQRFLAFEYEISSLLFYSKIVTSGLIDTEKYKSKNNTLRNDPIIDQAFIRSCLLIEFEILRQTVKNMLVGKNGFFVPLPDKNLPLDKKIELAQDYKRLIDILYGENSFVIFNCYQNLNKKAIEQFLQNANNCFHRQQLFPRNKGRFLSILGSYYMELERHDQLTKTHKQIALYNETNNDGTASYESVNFLSALGFSITARSLYLSHKDLKIKYYKKIQFYLSNLNQYNFHYPWQLDDPIYLHAINFTPS